MGKKKRNKSGQASGSGAVATEIRQVSTPRPQGYSVAQASKPNFFTGGVFEWLAIAAASVIAYWYLTARIVGVQVSVLADEYLYLLDAHYNGLSEAKYPNYLFQWIYSSTKLCGAEFYSCARSINAFVVIVGTIFIYLLAKQIGHSKWLGALAAVAAILGSYGTYTAYFMPEAIFNGLMMVFFWAIIRFGKTDNLLVWSAIGSSLGIASLAKPHGLFVVPAVVIFLTLWTRATRDSWLIPALLRNVVFVSSVVGAKFMLGYLLAGELALSLFGVYGSLQGVGQTAAETITSATGTNVLVPAWGQTLMITMILGLSLPIAILGLIQAFKKDSTVIDSLKFRALFALSLLNLMAVVAVFEATNTGEVWMHTRYYAYLIPLAVVALIEAWKYKEFEFWRWAKILVIGIFVSLSLVNLVTNAAPFSSNWIDGPDFIMNIKNLALSQVLTFSSIVLAFWWWWNQRFVLNVALAIAVLAATVSGSHNTNFLNSTFGYEMGYEHIAKVLRDFVPQSEVDRLVMVGQNEVVQRTIFSSLSGTISNIGSGEDGIEIQDLPKNASWLVTIGEVAVNGIESPTITGLGYNFYSLDSANSLIPRTDRISDISNECSSGDLLGWACGSETEISIDGQFETNASVTFIFEIPKELEGVELEFSIGKARVSAAFAAGLNSGTIQFDNGEPVSQMAISRVIDVPNDASGDPKLIRVLWLNSN